MVARSTTIRHAGLKGGDAAIESVSTKTSKSNASSKIRTVQGIKSSSGTNTKKACVPSSKSKRTAKSKGATVKTHQAATTKGIATKPKPSPHKRQSDGSNASSRSKTSVPPKTQVAKDRPTATCKKNVPVRIKSSRAAPRPRNVKTVNARPLFRSVKSPKSLESKTTAKSNQATSMSAKDESEALGNSHPASTSTKTRCGKPSVTQRSNISSTKKEDTVSTSRNNEVNGEMHECSRKYLDSADDTTENRANTKPRSLTNPDSTSASNLLQRTASGVVSKVKSRSARSSKRYPRRSRDTWSCEDSTDTSYGTRPVAEITFSDAQCSRMLADTYGEMSKYTLQPIGNAVENCAACGPPNDDSSAVVHIRATSLPRNTGKPSPGCLVSAGHLHHHPNCPSIQNGGTCSKDEPTCTSPKTQRTPWRPYADDTTAGKVSLSGNADELVDINVRTGIPPKDCAVDNKTAAISALTIPPMDVQDGAFKLTVHDQVGEKTLHTTQYESCTLDLDQLALQGLRSQYDDFVTNSKEQVVAMRSQLLQELSDMDMAKVKEKAGEFGHNVGHTVSSYGVSVSNLFHKSNESLPNSEKKARSRNQNHVTVITPSEEAQSEWESGNVQLRISESQHHLTESAEPAMNPYARLDAVEVVPTRASLQTVAEVAEEELKEEEMPTASLSLVADTEKRDGPPQEHGEAGTSKH